MTVSALRISKPKLPVSCPEDWLEEEFFEPDPRAESVCYRGQALAIMQSLLRTFLPGGKAAFAAVPRVLPGEGDAPRHSQL